MEIGANTLHDIGAMFLCDVRLRKDHGEMSLMSLELGVVPLLGRRLSYCIFDVPWTSWCLC